MILKNRYKKALRFLCALFLLSIIHYPLSIVNAQYYSWGGDPLNVKWRKIKTPDVKLIYPSYAEENARRLMWYLDTIRPHMGFGFKTHGNMPTPVVMHTQNMVGNGMVMWAPKRIEMLTAPSATYSEPWLKQLVFHEYRHNVQYNNLRRGTNRVLGWFFGQQILFLGVGQFSIYILEGDAVMMETELSAFGRGLQPSWTMHYRAVNGGRSAGSDPPDSLAGRQRRLYRREARRDRQTGRIGSRDYATDYWFCGSMRDFVPDHYHTGYQMARWLYNKEGRFVWDSVARYVSRNPQFITPMIIDLKKQTRALDSVARRGVRKARGLNQTRLFRRAFADLGAHWDSLPVVEDSSVRVATPETSYTTYEWPMWLDDKTLIAFKKDLDRSSRIVRVDAATGAEKVLAHTGAVSSRPAMADGVVWWTEYRGSLLWQQKVDSRLCWYDIERDRKGVLNTGGWYKNGSRADADIMNARGYRQLITRLRSTGGQVFYPTAVPDGGLAFVAYDYSGRFSILKGMAPDEPDGVVETLADFPLGVEVKGLAWDDTTAALYYIGLDDGGMFLGRVTNNELQVTSQDSTKPSDTDGDRGWERLTPSRHITISDLAAGGGRLYFGSIASGKDEAHCYDIASGTEYRLSESAFGSFQPAPSADGARVALTTYDRHGYHLAVQDAAAPAVQEQQPLPVDLNPQWKRWPVPKMDSLVYTPEAAERSAKKLHPKRYLKGFKLFNPHSWLPIGFYPPAAIQEMDLTVGAGATVMSQNLLSDMTSWLSYGWSRRGGHLFRGGASYSGLGPVLSVDFAWGGGRQLLYTNLPADVDVDRKAYFSVTTAVSVPMTLGSGYWHSALTPRAEYFYTNGLFYSTARRQARSGVNRLGFYLSYSGQTRMAQKEFLPRWGVFARVGYVTNPKNSDFRQLYSIYAGGYLPGVVRPHSVRLRANWQQVFGPGNIPFNMKDFLPRGVLYNFATRRWAAGSVDYQLPVWYPEGGIPSVLYFKRVRLNLFFDYAHMQSHRTGVWSRLFSYGGDVIVDISPLRVPASTNIAVKFTLAKPSDQRGVFFNFGVEVPI